MHIITSQTTISRLQPGLTPPFHRHAGCYFIDRDGRHFHQILNHLRDGQFNYPANSTDFRYLLELRAEAEYYGLTALVSQIDRYPYNMLKVVRATQINDSDNWMYEDSPDEVVFTVDKPCQLLGAGMCGTEGGMTVDLEVTEVRLARLGWLACYCCCCCTAWPRRGLQRAVPVWHI